ncbi:MAG: RNA-binding protein [Lawsonibacter sp.]|jgi:RNA-binding protein YlmH
MVVKCVTKKELLDRCARSGEERVLLARVLDKLEQAQNRGIPTYTAFLSPGEGAAVTGLLAAWGYPKHCFWGGYEQAERRICAFLPDWQEEEAFCSDSEGPVAAIEARFPDGASLGHRDILGSLMGIGLTREKLGDILLPSPGRCQVIVLREVLPILLSQWEQAGRWHLSVKEVLLNQLEVRPAQVKTVRDTVATLRLDSVLAAGFSLSRSKAAAYISAGKVALNHLECLKGDKPVESGDVLTCRGLGKCVVKEVLGASKKGRIMLILERYI